MHEEAVTNIAIAALNGETDTSSDSADDYRAIFQATGDGVIIAEVSQTAGCCPGWGMAGSDLRRKRGYFAL